MPSSSERASTVDAATVEDTLKELMTALRLNGRDDWEGKPQQEDILATATATATSVIGNDMEVISVEDPTLGNTSALGSSSSPPRSVATDADRESLDALMREFLGSVRQVREMDEGGCSSNEVTAATTTIMTTSGRDNGTQAVAANMEFEDLLAALDSLPSLK